MARASDNSSSLHTISNAGPYSDVQKAANIRDNHSKSSGSSYVPFGHRLRKSNSDLALNKLRAARKPIESLYNIRTEPNPSNTLVSTVTGQNAGFEAVREYKRKGSSFDKDESSLRTSMQNIPVRLGNRSAEQNRSLSDKGNYKSEGHRSIVNHSLPQIFGCILFSNIFSKMGEYIYETDWVFPIIAHIWTDRR